MNKFDRAVIDLSVYNALSRSGHDMTTDQIVAFLRKHWKSSRNARSIDAGIVEKSASRLMDMEAIVKRGDVWIVPFRTLRGWGCEMRLNDERTQMVMA